MDPFSRVACPRVRENGMKYETALGTREQSSPTLSSTTWRRLRVVAARLRRRPSHVVEELLLDALDGLELQAKAVEGERCSAAKESP